MGFHQMASSCDLVRLLLFGSFGLELGYWCMVLVPKNRKYLEETTVKPFSDMGFGLHDFQVYTDI